MTLTKAPPRPPASEKDPQGPPISISGLSKQFGHVRAVDNLTFDVRAGTVTGFLGANGAGKTTTLRMLLGLAEADAGRALVFDRSYRETPNPGRTVGALLDTGIFHPRRSGHDHLRWAAHAMGLPQERVDEVLAMVSLDLAAGRPVGEYSLGMKQRLGLAGALLGDPQLLVLDEPANGLDPAGIRWLRDVMRDFAASGKTVFVSSHQLSEVANVADEVVVIDRGRLLTHTTVPELTGAAAPVTLVRSPSPEVLRTALAASGATAIAGGDGDIRIVGLEPEQVGEIAAANGIALHALSHATRSLEDVFLALTRKEEIDGDD